MTTNLLIFFAIPFAVIIFSIALQKLLRNPFLVSAIIFSILLIIVLAFFDTIYLIAVVAYTILSFITAVITCLICRYFDTSQISNCMFNSGNNNNCMGNNENNNNCMGNNGNNNSSNTEVITISNDGVNNTENSLQNGFSGLTGSYAQNCTGRYNRRR